MNQPRPLVIVLHGPSGAGKDSVIDELRARTGIHRATSSTSREARDDELNGNHYHFLSEEEFREKIQRGDFAEWAIVYGDYKGLERSEVEGPLSKGDDVIIRTDVQGAKTWREKLEGAVFIFLMADDNETLKVRLKKRGSESQASFDRRVAALGSELEDIDNNDYVVHNRKDQLAEAVEELERIIRAEHEKPSRPAARLLS